MRKNAGWALGLCVVTVGLGVWGWYLDPWIGEMGSGEHPLLLFGVPMLVAAILLGAAGAPMPLAILGAGVVQFGACLLIVWVARASLQIARRAAGAIRG